MTVRNSLKARITVAFVVLGAVVSLMLAAAFYWLNNSLEKQLVEDTLSSELESFMERRADDVAAPVPHSSLLRIEVADRAGLARLPAATGELTPGLHRILVDGDPWFAMVRDRGNERFVAMYDAAGIDWREKQYEAFLTGAVLVMLGISAALGFWLAERVVAPLGELADRVGKLEPAGQPLNLARKYPDDETGRLAAAFDAYQNRLRAFIQREQAFTGDVSHELRTPLAVIEGAVEVLLADESLSEVQCTRVRRIARAVREMGEISAALLELAREQGGGSSDARCEVEPLLQEVVESHRYLLDSNQVAVDVDVKASPVLAVECALLRIVLGNLIRNAFSYTREGCVRISLDWQGMSVTDTGMGIPSDQLDEIFKPFYSGHGGGGIGLSLVWRICEHYGWEITAASQPGEGARFRLNFRGAVPPAPAA